MSITIQVSDSSDITATLTSSDTISVHVTTGLQGPAGADGAAGADGSDGSPDTAAQIKTKYESNDDTNAFTDSEKTKLANTEISAQLDDRDTANRDRSNHTGTQAIATVDGLETALDSKSEPLTNVVEYSDGTYRYYVGDTTDGWQVNRETRSLPWVRTKASGATGKPTDLAAAQSETYA